MISLDKPKISIYLTNRCNLNCKHCFIEGSPQNHIFLSWSKIKNLLNFYKNQFPIVEFTGGEAILSPYINKSIKLAKHLGFYVGVSTNGLDKTLISNYTPTQIDKLTFSLDGSQPKTHDFLRGRGVFWHCIENIKQAIKKGFRVEVVYTVHKLNINQINSTVDFLDNIGVKKISFNFISNRGHATFNQNILITGKDWITVRKQILAKLTTKQISLRYPIMFATPAEFKQITNKLQR